jgi:hypothetical protein
MRLRFAAVPLVNSWAQKVPFGSKVPDVMVTGEKPLGVSPRFETRMSARAVKGDAQRPRRASKQKARDLKLMLIPFQQIG